MPGKIEEISGPIEEILGRRRRPENEEIRQKSAPKALKSTKKQKENQGKHTKNEIFRRCAGQKLKHHIIVDSSVGKYCEEEKRRRPRRRRKILGVFFQCFGAMRQNRAKLRQRGNEAGEIAPKKKTISD